MSDRHDARSDASRQRYHELLLDNISTHASNAGLVEACFSGLKRLSFQSPSVKEEIALMKPFTRMCDVLYGYRENGDVMAAGLSLLCNLARSGVCCTALVENRLVSLAVSSMLQLQGNADVSKYSAWMLCNILLHKAVPRDQVEEVRTKIG